MATGILIAIIGLWLVLRSVRGGYNADGTKGRTLVDRILG